MFNPAQMAISLILAVLTVRLLQMIGWPWHAIVPAAILAALAGAGIYVLVWALVRRVTYPYVARRQRELLRAQMPAGEDERD